MSKSQELNDILKQWSRFKRPLDGDVYQHYKGGLYNIVATGFLEDSEAPCVVYRSQLKGVVWVRTAKDFSEPVEHAGKITPRFRRLDG